MDQRMLAPPHRGGYTSSVAMREVETLDDVWATYVADRCNCHRERLILAYYPLVQRVAGKMWRNFPSSQVDVEDLVSYGVLGLMRAITNYDPDRGVHFETYAVASIRSLVLDELRSLDWAPRSLRRKQREIDKFCERFESEHGRDPTAAEIAAQLTIVKIVQKEVVEVTMTEAEVWEVRRQSEASKPRSLDEEGEEETSRYDHVQDATATDPLDESTRTSVWNLMVDGIVQMTMLERLVLALYYFYGLPLRDVGRAAGIPESRAGQVHVGVMTKLRESLMEHVAAGSMTD